MYLRLGDRTLSRHHLELGRATVGALPDDGYAEMIRGGLTRVEDALTDAP